jgi:hypothetical protein
MTIEEQQQFRDQIAQTILPLAVNMTMDQVKNIIDNVQVQNPNLPEGFGNMLLEQILVAKSKLVSQG